jgi:hypothetical protein
MSKWGTWQQEKAKKRTNVEVPTNVVELETLITKEEIVEIPTNQETTVDTTDDVTESNVSTPTELEVPTSDYNTQPKVKKSKN